MLILSSVFKVKEGKSDEFINLIKKNIPVILRGRGPLPTFSIVRWRTLRNSWYMKSMRMKRLSNIISIILGTSSRKLNRS